MEWFGLGGAVDIRGQGCLPPDQVAPSPVQSGFEHLQGWAATASLGNPSQFSSLTGKSFFQYLI